MAQGTADTGMFHDGAISRHRYFEQRRNLIGPNRLLGHETSPLSRNSGHDASHFETVV